MSKYNTYTILKYSKGARVQESQNYFSQIIKSQKEKMSKYTILNKSIHLIWIHRQVQQKHSMQKKYSLLNQFLDADIKRGSLKILKTKKQGKDSTYMKEFKQNVLKCSDCQYKRFWR